MTAEKTSLQIGGIKKISKKSYQLGKRINQGGKK